MKPEFATKVSWVTVCKRVSRLVTVCKGWVDWLQSVKGESIECLATSYRGSVHVVTRKLDTDAYKCNKAHFLLQFWSQFIRLIRLCESISGTQSQIPSKSQSYQSNKDQNCNCNKWRLKSYRNFQLPLWIYIYIYDSTTYLNNYFSHTFFLFSNFFW